MKFKVVHLPRYESKWVPCKLNEAQAQKSLFFEAFPQNSRN